MKRYFIRFVAVLMAVILLAISPASDYLDTQGIGETQAAATTVITIGALLGALAGAYGIYIASDKVDAEAENWLAWTETNDTTAHSELSSIVAGVTTYAVSRAVMNSAKNYLSTKESEEMEILAYGCASAYNTLPDNATSRSFIKYLEENYPYALFVWCDPNSYGSGQYKVIRPNFNVLSSSSYYVDWNACFSDERVAEWYMQVDDGSTNSYFNFMFSAVDSDGMPLYEVQNNYSSGTINNCALVVSYFYYQDGAWVNSSNTHYYRSFSKSELETGYVYTPVPLYRTNYTYLSEGRDKIEVAKNSYVVKNSTIDYSLAGSNAQANTNALAGTVVTQGQLQTVYNGTATALNNAGDTAADNISSQELADIVSVAVASALVEAGISSSTGTDTDTDTGTDSGTNEEQVAVSNSILDFLKVDLFEKLIEMITGITAVNAVANAIKDGIEGQANKTELKEWFDQVVNGIAQIGTYDIDIWNTLQEIASNAISIDALTNAFPATAKVKEWVDEIIGAISNVGTHDIDIWNELTDVNTGVQDVVTGTDTATGVLENIRDKIGSIDYMGILQSILDAILAIPTAIIDGIASILRSILTELFVPDTAELEQTVDELYEEFSFAFIAKTIIEDIIGIIDGGGEPPEIYIHFENSENETYQQIGTLKVLDFAWYERYKPYGDAIISAILWAFFLIRFIHGLPNILKGVPQGVVTSADPNSINLDTSVRKI